MDSDNNDVPIKLKKDGTPAKPRGVRSGVKRGVYKTGKKRLKQKIVREAKAVLKSFPGQIPVDLSLSDEVIRSVENLKNGGNGIIPIGPNAREEAIVTKVDTESFIKKLKDAFEWEPQWFAELSKCAADPIYFIENYYTIISLDHGMIRMRLRPYQKDFIKAIHRNRQIVGRMGRQSGKTSLVAAYITWLITFHPSKTVAVAANNIKAATETLKRVKIGYSRLPRWMQQGVVNWNKGNILLENESQVICYACTPDGVRGQSLSLLYVDEMDIISPALWKEFWQACSPAIATGTDSKVILTSTPKGLKQLYEICRDADQKKNDFTHFHIPWNVIEGRDDIWRAKEIRTFGGGPAGERKFAQEYSCEFLGSSETIASVDVLTKLQSRDPVGHYHGATLYAQPDVRRSYLALVDIARGKGSDNDYSVIQVIDTTVLPFEQVAVFRSSDINLVGFAEQIAALASYYNTAHVLLERNVAGIGELLDVEYSYPHLIYTETFGRKGQQPLFESTGKSNCDYGVFMSSVVKRHGAQNLSMMLSNNTLVLRDQDTIDELFRFVKNRTGSFSAETGAHDDLVMALVMGAWYFGTEFFKDYFGADSGAIFNGRSNGYIKRGGTVPVISPPVTAVVAITGVRNSTINSVRRNPTEIFDGLEWEIIGGGPRPVKSGGNGVQRNLPVSYNSWDRRKQ